MGPFLWRGAACCAGAYALLVITNIHTHPHPIPDATAVVLSGLIGLAALIAALLWRGGNRARPVGAGSYLSAGAGLLGGVMLLTVIVFFTFQNLILIVVSFAYLAEVAALVGLAGWLVALGLRGTGITPRGYAFEIAFRDSGSPDAPQRRAEWLCGLGLWLAGTAGAVGLAPLMFATAIFRGAENAMLYIVQATTVGVSGAASIRALTQTFGIDAATAMRVVAFELTLAPLVVSAAAAFGYRALFLRAVPGGRAALAPATIACAVLLPAGASVAGFATASTIVLEPRQLLTAAGAAAVATPVYAMLVTKLVKVRIRARDSTTS